MNRTNLKNFLCITALLSAIIFTEACSGGASEKAAAAKDSAAKAAANAVKPGTPMKYDSTKRYIYLTWDDGPQPPGTIICKKIFHDMGVKATFFMVGMHQFDHLRKNIADSVRNGYPEFLLANHSYTHGFRNNYKMFYSHPDSAVADFLRAEKELNVQVKIIRFPGNNTWVGKDEIKGPKSTLNVARLLDSMQYSTIGWDIEWAFGKNSAPIQSVDEMIREVNKKFDDYTSNYENHVVILAHDRMFATPQYADSLRRFITLLKQDPRNAFETVDHYPIVQNR